MMDDEEWNMVKKYPKTLAIAKMRTKETAAADVLNFGFTAGGGGKAVFTGGDSQPLFSTNHVSRNGRVTQSNMITTPLSQQTLQTVVTTMKKRRDSKNELVGFMPDTLIVPTELEFTARIILETMHETGSDRNDVNPIKGALNLVVWPYLSSPTAWFVQDSMNHELNFFNRKDTGVVGPYYDFDTGTAKWKVECRFSVGFSDWMGIYGSTGV